MNPQPLLDLLKPQRITEIVDIGANPIDGDPPYKPMLRAGEICKVTGFEPQEDVDAEWVQQFGNGWSAAPALRYYTQTAAKFYVEVDPRLSPFPANPPPNALYFSEDQRMSAFGGLTMGMKFTKQLNLDTKVDVKFEQYGQKGAWILSGTGSKGLAPFYARNLQVGITRSF